MDYNVTYRQKDGSIQAIISYKDSTEKWKQKSKQGFKTQKSAKPWVEETIESLSKTVKYINHEYANYTYSELFDAFIEHSELYVQPNTIVNYFIATQHFTPLHELPVNKITSIDIQNCTDKMVKIGLNASTINNYLVRIKTMFNYAIKKRVIKENPVCDIVIPTNKIKIDEKIKALSKSEVDDLLKKMKVPRQYYISLVAVACGLRIGELLALKWNDIDEKNRLLTINEQWKLINRSTRKHGEGIVKRPNSNRIVPIPSNTMEELKKYKSSYPIDISGRLFPYTSSNSASSTLKLQYVKCGYDISIHDLRHTYVSFLVSQGLDFQTIAALIGDTVEITIKTYSHFTSDMMEKAKKAVENIF